jgi:hypothetical protein
MKPQPEIGDTQLSREENKLAELERQKRIIETKEHHGLAIPFALYSLRVRWKLSKKTLCTTSDEPRTIVADESYPDITSRVLV